MMANAFRRKLHGSTVTYVRVVDLKLPKETWPQRLPNGAGEVRIFQTPDTMDAAVTVVASARDLAGRTSFSAFCLFELSKFSEGLPVVLAALKRAGLDLITQAPLDRLRSPEQALEAATDAGLRVARVTIDETPDRPWSDICGQLTDIQRKIQSVRVFAPLSRKLNVTQPTTGYEDVKRVALSRLLVQNVDAIQVDWELYGPKLAQVALTFGADDVDSVSAEEDDSKGHRRSPLEEIRRSIRAAGFEPAERDARFELL
jgi:aminodeoxyfutalosine synthase